MIHVSWAILEKSNRFLLIQRADSDAVAGGTWSFPGGKRDATDVSPIETAKRELLEETGLVGRRFRRILQTEIDQYRIGVFLCDQWDNHISITCLDVIGAGWFTISEMYDMGNYLSPFANHCLPIFSYITQHYKRHPKTLDDLWTEV